MSDECAPSDGLLQSPQSVTYGLLLSEQNKVLKWDLKREKHIRSGRNCEAKALNQRFVLPSAVHGARQEEVIDHRLTDREWAEEWKHLDNVRIGVVDMC